MSRSANSSIYQSQDNIRLKKDLAAIGDTPIKDFDIVYELLEGKHPNAFILHK